MVRFPISRKVPIHLVFYVLLLVSIPNQLGYHFWPSWSLVLGRRIDYLSPTVYVTDIVCIFFCASFLMSKNNRLAFSRLFRFSSLPLIIACIVLNVVFAISPMVAVYWWIRVAQMVFVAAYIIIVKPSIKTTATALFIAALYSAALAIGQSWFQHSLGGVFSMIGERTFTIDTPGIARMPVCMGSWSCIEWLRPYATFPHPNVLAGFLAIALSFFVSAHMYASYRLSVISSSAIIIIGLVLTASRSALGALCVSVFLWKYMNSLVHRKKAYVFVGLAACIVLLAAVAVRFGITDWQLGLDESFTRRIQLLIDAARVFITSPILGVGLGNFIVILPSVSDIRIVNYLQPVHSLYALMLVETGIFGLMYFIVSLYKNRHVLKEFGTSATMRVYMLPLFTLLLIGFVDHYMGTLQQGRLMLAVCVGYCLLGIKEYGVAELKKKM